jgi:hypothetical protein
MAEFQYGEKFNSELPLTKGDFVAPYLSHIRGQSCRASQVSILTTATTLIAPRNGNRVMLNVQNTSSASTTYVWLVFQDGAASYTGYRIAQNGAYEFNLTNLYVGPVYAIATGATATACFMEVTKSDVGVYPQ